MATTQKWSNSVPGRKAPKTSCYLEGVGCIGSGSRLHASCLPHVRQFRGERLVGGRHAGSVLHELVQLLPQQVQLAGGRLQGAVRHLRGQTES